MITQFMDCISPMPILGSLSKSCWGAAETGARDQSNGLEDTAMTQYSYWDGGIIRDEETGVYYLFASRWEQSGGFEGGENGGLGWHGSKAIYATSNSLYGPYTDQGELWPDEYGGVGHNVFPFALSKNDPLFSEGYRYAIVISDVGTCSSEMNGVIHIAKSLQGPWLRLGRLSIRGNSSFSLSNLCILRRPDGVYEAINRHGDIALTHSLSDTWEVYRNSLWNDIPGLPPSSRTLEDPILWYSGGFYHCVVNRWDTKEAYYLTSRDGLNGWACHSGLAYTPRKAFLSYEDGTTNTWAKLERPNVYIENGSVRALTFAVINVEKDDDHGNDRNGSKIIVVPFDHEKLIAFVQADPCEQATSK